MPMKQWLQVDVDSEIVQAVVRAIEANSGSVYQFLYKPVKTGLYTKQLHEKFKRCDIIKGLVQSNVWSVGPWFLSDEGALALRQREVPSVGPSSRFDILP